MYNPYFRGKQYDLIALIEAVNSGFLSKDIIPLIEPVRDNKYLRKVAECFIHHKHNLLMVVNPQVGRVREGQEKIHDIQDLFPSDYITPVFILSEEFLENYQDRFSFFERPGSEEFVYLSYRYSRHLPKFLEQSSNPKFHIISDSALLRKSVPQNRVLLTDPFNFLKHGEDYLELEDEFYSDSDKFYLDEGYIGFSNFGIDGASYFDKGYPSRTVVLHVLYIDRYRTVRIKHFASDTNETMANPAGKFFEALGKLTSWYRRYEDKLILTQGLAQLMEFEKENKYPGAGVIKKLLVIHQLELYSRLIQTD